MPVIDLTRFRQVFSCTSCNVLPSGAFRFVRCLIYKVHVPQPRNSHYLTTCLPSCQLLFYLFQTFFVDRILLMCAALSDSFVRLPYTESFCNPYFSISQHPDRNITIISCSNFVPYTMYNRIVSVSPSIVNYCYLHSRFKVLKYLQHSYSDEGHPVRCCKRLQQRAAGRCKAAEQQRPNYRPEPRSEALRSGRRRRARPLQRCGYVSIL